MLRERLNADRSCRQAHGRNGTYCGFLYTAEAERIIAKVAAMGDETRLFMYFAAHNVHAPWQAPYAPPPPVLTLSCQSYVGYSLCREENTCRLFDWLSFQSTDNADETKTS